MAFRSFSEDDFSCPVCCEIFKDPVLLTCSHSTCAGCLQRFWETKGSRECPVCRTQCSKEMYPLNLVLKNLCEVFQQESSHREPVCSQHHSKLKLFCEDDKQLVCLVCRDSKLHKNHKFSPISEAALEHKVELTILLKTFEEKLETFNKVKILYNKTAQHIKVQAQHSERQIKEEFEKLHQCLQKEEAARIAAVKKDEKQKSQMMKEKIEKMSREISSLSDTIRAIEEDMGAADITFLQNYRSTVERARRTLQDPERVPGDLINVAKHLGNLKFRVWKKMREVLKYTPVTLDPNTAHGSLNISEGLTSMKYTDEWSQLPDNPERFDVWANVLGSEGFNSGTHFWDVQVGDNTDWDVGVLSESAKRKGDIDTWSGIWYVVYKDGKYYTVSTPQPESLLIVKTKPQRIRVKLDWDKGKVSLYDLDNITHLHTFVHTFTERVFPFFGSQCVRFPLRILPTKTSVRISQ